MRTCALFLGLCLAANLVGCAVPGPEATNTVRAADGLAVSIETAKRAFVAGERLNVLVTAKNHGGAKTIGAVSGAPAYVRLLQHVGIGWEEVRRYPETEMMVISPWQLEAGQKRQFILPLTVEPDWPVGELLRLTAELNGRPDVAPGVVIEVLPGGEGGE